MALPPTDKYGPYACRTHQCDGIPPSAWTNEAGGAGDLSEPR